MTRAVSGWLSILFALITAAMVLTPATAMAQLPPQDQLGAGAKIVMVRDDGSPISQCTVAAVGNDRFGNKVALTAGHCGAVGTKVVSADGTVALGTFATSKTFPGSANIFPAGFAVQNVFDYAFIKLNDNVVMTDYAPSPVNVKSIVAPSQWQFPVCKYGWGANKPSEKCGINTGIRPIEFDSTAMVDFGDSGGPMYVNRTQLIGIISRPVNIPYVSPTISTRADAAVRDATANGAVGAGFVPVA